VGSALVVLTGFGIIYSIPSLLITLRPAFKAYFSGTGKPKPPAILLEDL
jgi:hypothetical protein